MAGKSDSPVLTQTERDRPSRKLVSGGMIQHGTRLDEAAKRRGHQHRRTRTVRWQPCSNSVDGSSGYGQRPGLSRVGSAAHRLQQNRAVPREKCIEIQHMWVQEAVRSGKLTVEKNPSETNSSDLGTKHLTRERSEMFLRLVNCFYVRVLEEARNFMEESASGKNWIRVQIANLVRIGRG